MFGGFHNRREEDKDDKQSEQLLQYLTSHMWFKGGRERDQLMVDRNEVEYDEDRLQK